MTLVTEIKQNFETFFADWTKQAPVNWKALQGNKVFEESYRRLCCVIAVRMELLEPKVSKSAYAFALEANNDALTSHVLASIGAWRPSLQALRSYIENMLCCLFYMDHPVELALWSQGKNRPTFSDLHSYFVAHPSLSGIGLAVSGLEQMKKEYSDLSKAVHGSAASFRMTDGAGKILLWDATIPRASQWSTRERKTIESVTLLITYLFSQELQGARLPKVRELLSFAISKNLAQELKKRAKITI
jgi:hypothetical protein